MNRNEEIKLDFFMSRIKHLEDIKETEKTKLSVVLYEATHTTCILRVCKNRNLSAVCDALLQVKNPNVTLVYQYVYAGGHTYILEEMLSGKTLEQILAEEGLFSEIETARIISAVCSGLSDFHRIQPPVIHNDINTSNIMICDDKRVKLFDFDISRTYKKDASKNTELFGTEEYASPEHYGYGQSEPRTDIYSLGVTIHRMLCGKYLSANRKCLYKGRMKKIIEKCIEIDPNKRYSSVAHLKKDLEKVQNRKRTTIKLIALLCVVAVLFVGSTFVFGRISNQDNLPILQGESSDHTFTEVPNDTTPHTTKAQENETPEKVIVAEKLNGKLLSLISLNDGTFVYLEKLNEEYRIKSSAGADSILLTTQEAQLCELIYNAYTDNLYIVTVNGDESCIYSLSKDFEINDTPLYKAAGSYATDIKGLFFSDGTLYCNSFGKDFIDTGRWCEIGYVKCSPAVVTNDRFYSINNNFYMLDELSISGECTNQYEIPGDRTFHRVCCTDSKALYLTVKKNNKDYVYAFDGENFRELVCLNNYQLYAEFKCTAMAVTNSKIWMYDSGANAIKEFTI